MPDLSTIKSQTLKSLIEESYRFSILNEEEQQILIEKIASTPLEKQELAYIPFFKKKNIEEDKIVEKRESAFGNLLEKIKEADKYIKSLAIKQVEEDENTLEKEKEANLFKQLNEI